VDAPDNPCAHCGKETGSDAMTWCDNKCFDAWKRAEEQQRIRDNLARSKEGETT
jgi:hypothetical protein